MADNNKEICCPACGEKMVKVFMPSQKLNIDVCVNGCGGIYFDNREFPKFDSPDDDITPILEVLKDKKFKSVDETVTRKCPVCGSNMVKNFSNPKKEIEVDECYSCGGKFLDYNELEKIRNQYSTDEVDNYKIIRQLCLDAGVEYIQPYYSKNKIGIWENKAVQFGLFGLIVSILSIFYFKNLIFKDENIISYFAAIIASIGISILFAGIGALFDKINNKYK